MALTVATITNADFTEGNKRRKVRTVTFDSSYATGGESLTPADVGLRSITEAISHGPFVKTDRTDAVAVHYSISTAKLLAYQSTTGAPAKMVEVANATDLSAYSGRITFVGY